MKRRRFLEFLGVGVVGVAIPVIVLDSCKGGTKRTKAVLKGIKPSFEDEVILHKDLEYTKIVSWGDKIGEEIYFGSHNDYLAFIPENEENTEGYLWVNHEYLDQLFVSGTLDKSTKSRGMILREMKEVGASIIRIKMDSEGYWEMIADDPGNKRIDAFTQIPFAKGKKIMGTNMSVGTMANCAGGVTPWGTVLTCEENYSLFYGDEQNGEKIESKYGWDIFFNRPPEHYGWVVEVDPISGKAIKHTSLGRCEHECATVVQLEDKRVVVYTGDDKENECIHKFVSSKPNSLDHGTLYVANLKEGKWIPLVYNSDKRLKAKFTSQTDMLIRLREAAKIVGGTPLDRPEDIEINPINGDVLISLTNNKESGNYFGSILKIQESNGDYSSTDFQHDTFLSGGEETGFACPDNLAFDKNGNLWFTSDFTHIKSNSNPYKKFKNNGLYFVPASGDEKGEVIQVASAPLDAEFTGPCFSPDGKSLFLSVQHPGEKSVSTDELTSLWPDGEGSLPKSSVIVIQGKFLEDWSA
jgi:secreted PhoX family phosphatase